MQVMCVSIDQWCSCCDFRYVQEDIEAVEEWSTESFLNPSASTCSSPERGFQTSQRELFCLTTAPCKGSMFSIILVIYYPKTCRGLPMCRQVAQEWKWSLDYFIMFYSCSSADTLTQLYVSLICPRLENACPIWAPHMAKDIHAIESVQKFKWPHTIGMPVTMISQSYQHLKGGWNWNWGNFWRSSTIFAFFLQI